MGVLRYYWYGSLTKQSLLYVVDIHNEAMLDKFINMLLRLRSCKYQVEILKLNISPTFDKQVLCNILPNLRVFGFSNMIYSHQMQNHCSLPFQPKYLNTKLESIIDGGELELTRQLLMFHSCSHLSILKLEIDQIINPRNKIFIHLKSALALKEFYLSCCTIGTEDVEIIHENTPALETLLVAEMNLIAGELPHDIIPATSVTEISIVIDEVED